MTDACVEALRERIGIWRSTLHTMALEGQALTETQADTLLADSLATLLAEGVLPIEWHAADCEIFREDERRCTCNRTTSPATGGAEEWAHVLHCDCDIQGIKGSPRNHTDPACSELRESLRVRTA